VESQKSGAYDDAWSVSENLFYTSHEKNSILAKQSVFQQCNSFLLFIVMLSFFLIIINSITLEKKSSHKCHKNKMIHKFYVFAHFYVT
jgi:hypothetical protein